MNRAELAQRVRIAYDRCKDFPETGTDGRGNFVVRADAYMALIELRNLAPDIEAALREGKSSNIAP
jgi:hypothetical protein